MSEASVDAHAMPAMGSAVEPSPPLAELMRRGDVLSPSCPAREILQHVTSRWGVLVLVALQGGTLRFSELRRKVGVVSERMLAQTLQVLERDGFVERRAYPVVPPHVDYRLTPLGLLFTCAVVASCGLLLLGNATGVAMCLAAVTVYGFGKTFFWPTMLAVASERFPRGGAMTLGAIGGVGMLSAALVLSIMVIPFSSSVAREVLKAVPQAQREGAYALGATKWEAIRMALFYARTGIVGAVMLGFGRALGETMAVTMVICNNPQITWSLYAPQYTMAAVLANEFTEAADDLYLNALVEIGLVLFVITVIINVISRLFIWSMGRQRRPRLMRAAAVKEAA